MKTKRILFTTGAILLFGLGLMAQPGEGQSDKREKIQALKIAFITQKLDLTSEEAQVFWPVYNGYQKERKALRMINREKFHKNGEEGKRLEDMSDKEIEAVVDNEIEFKQRELQVQMTYHQKFKSVLPILKVAKLYKAEKLFKRDLLRKMRDNRQPPPRPDQPDR